MSGENLYTGFGNDVIKRAFIAITIGDTIQNVYNAIRALAVDKKNALGNFAGEWEKILERIVNGSSDEIYTQLKCSSSALSSIERIHSLKDAVKVALVGEIFIMQTIRLHQLLLANRKNQKDTT